MRHVISVLVENEFGVLSRVAGLFSSRGFNIESLTVAETRDATISRITLVTHGDDSVVEQIEKQLKKLICVIEVIDFSESPHVERELVLIKVTTNEKTRAEFMNLIDIFRGKVIDVGTESYIVEVTGSHDKIEAILKLLEPIGISEINRTGKVAMHRGMQTLKSKEGTERAA